MKKDNDLIDSLLREHAKMKNGEHYDELFLQELERRLDEEENQIQCVADEVVESPIYKISSSMNSASKSRWALGLGAAACATIGFMAYQSSNNDHSQGGVVLTANKAQEQISDVKSKLRNESQSEVLLKEREKTPEMRYQRANNKPLSEMKNEAIDQEESKKSSMVHEAKKKKDAQKTPFSVIKPVPTSKESEPALEFADENDFGEGWGEAGHGSGGGGAPAKAQPHKRAASKATTSSIGLHYSDKTKNGRHTGIRLTGMIAGDDKDQAKGKLRHPALTSSERYGDLIENQFITPTDKDKRRSTFAVDVDTASYTNLRRMINAGNIIPASAVRIEEMINYFDYSYAQPTAEARHPFAVHVDSATCPWNKSNKLVRIAIQGKDVVREKRPASNIVFLLDVSGSMNSSNKLPLLKESLKFLLEELNEKDTVTIAVYAGASGLALPPTRVTAEGRKAILSSLDKLRAGGSTAGGQGIKLAYKMAKENFVKDGINRVILATDGDFNVGVSDNKALTEMVQKKAKDGVYLSVLGLGTGNINDSMMESISNSGNGNYSYIDSIKEGRKVLLEDMMGTMMTIAKDVKVRLEFNPEKVKEYRLVGYANRVLPNAAFLDKTADAGEIGAGHTVTAFYEIVPGKAADKKLLDDLRYAKKKETSAENEVPSELSDELLYVDLAYKQPDQRKNDESTFLNVVLKDTNKPWEETDHDFKFASSVALFGMILRDSDYRGDGDLDLVEKLAEAGKGNDGKGHRVEFLQLVKKTKASK